MAKISPGVAIVCGLSIGILGLIHASGGSLYVSTFLLMLGLALFLYGDLTL